MKKQIDVVGAVVIRNGAVLAARRGAQMSLPGKWEFPGGKIEAGERAENALVREMLEELLCPVRVGKHVTTATHEYDFGVVTISTFYATLINSEPRRTEHSEIRWIPIPDLRSVEWAPADIPTVQRIMREHADRPIPEE